MKHLIWLLPLLSACGSSSPATVYATAAKPVALCPTGVRGAWYCDQATTTAMISPAADGNYTAYAPGTYNSGLSGISCGFTVSTVKTLDDITTCYITTN